MKLTPEELNEFAENKRFFMQSLHDIALLLRVDERELFLTVSGSEVHPEVVQAVREWIA